MTITTTQIKNAYIDYRFDYSGDPLDIYGHIINSAEQLNPLLAHLKSIGYNTVTLNLDVPIDMRTGLINLGSLSDGTDKDLPRDIWKSVDYAHSLGLSVNLEMIPCVIYNSDGSFNQSDTVISTIESDGDLIKHNLSIDTVFKSITEYETKIAALAQQHGVDGYYIGQNNFGYDTAEYLPYWQTIVDSVKQVFSGKILYQAAYDNAVFGIVDTVAYIPNPIVSTTPMYDLSKIIEALYNTSPWAGSKQNYIDFLSGLADKYSNKTFILDDFTANAANPGIGNTFFPFSLLMSDPSKLSELPQPNYKQQALAYQMMIYVANYLLPNKIEGIGLAEYTMWGDASWIQKPQNDVGQLWNLMDRDSANLMNNPIVDSAIKNAFLYNPLLPLPVIETPVVIDNPIVVETPVVIDKPIVVETPVVPVSCVAPVIETHVVTMINYVIVGSNKADKLTGLTGNDTLIGGMGKDTLTGGDGSDIFKFDSRSETGITSKLADIITDFSHTQGDRIDLSDMDANAVLKGNQSFTFIGDKIFSKNHPAELRFDAKTHTLYGNTDNDSAAEFAIVLNGVKSLVVDDFIL